MRSILLASILAFSPAVLQAQTLSSRSLSGAQAIAIAGGGSGDGSGGGTQRLVTAPSVIAPSFYGANPCGNSASGGGSWLGTGISFGGQWTEPDCRAMDNYRMLVMGGQPRLAMAHLCDRISDLRRVASEIGEPCPQDVIRVVAASIAQMTASAPVTQSVAAPPRPLWCETSSAAELRSKPECR